MEKLPIIPLSACRDGSSRPVDPRASRPIGIFDSGLGGLTVAREIARKLPHEDFIYFGDSARCPYGPRDPQEVREFVLEICRFLVEQDVKLIVIACNTATAAGLELAQQTFKLPPIMGVIKPGAHAAVQATHSRRIAVIGTKGTIDSAEYTTAIKQLDAGAYVKGIATPELADIVEAGPDESKGEYTHITGQSVQELIEQYLHPLAAAKIDVLVLGCTHYPVLAEPIQAVVGDDVTLISSAEEVALEVYETLKSREHLNLNNDTPKYEFYTTGEVDSFRRCGTHIFGSDFENLTKIEL